MPTAAKLVGAVLMGVLAWFAADAVDGHLPPEVRRGLLHEIAVFFGLLVGWRFLGRRSDGTGGLRSGIGLGLSASVAFTLVALIYFAGHEMIKRSLRKSYDDPFEAIQDMFQIGIDYFEYLGHGDVLLVLLGGGILVGILTHGAARRWP